MTRFTRRHHSDRPAAMMVAALCLVCSTATTAGHRYDEQPDRLEAQPRQHLGSARDNARSSHFSSERRSLSGRTWGYRSGFERDRARAWGRHDGRYRSNGGSNRGYDRSSNRYDKRRSERYGYGQRSYGYRGGQHRQGSNDGLSRRGRSDGSTAHQYHYPGKPPTLSTPRPLRRHGQRY